MNHNSIPFPDSIEFIDIQEVNPLISKVKIKVCYVQDTPNRNGTVITEELARKFAHTLPGSPIVGYYNQEKGDFESHNEFLQFKDGEILSMTNTRPYGFVDIGAKVWFEEYLDDNESARKYLVTEGYLWTGEYPETQQVVDSGNPQSMHFKDDESYQSEFDENRGFWIVNEALISNLCILGNDVEPCFQGSSVTKFSLDSDFQTKMFGLIAEMKDMLKNNCEGGKTMNKTNDNNINTSEDELQYKKQQEEDEKKKKTSDEDKGAKEPEKEPKSEPEPEEDEKKKKKYELEEIPEYVQLKTDYENLQKTYEALNAEVESLKQFKANVETDKKNELINSFYMLSDDDKKEIKENVTSYSYDDIKAKLSIMCVDKKVSFAKEEPKANTTVTYSINTTDADMKPEWLKAVDKYNN